MDISTAVINLAALAQESRLEIFRLLVQKGPEGLCVSEIGEHMGIAGATLSFHLKELHRASLITARRESRHIYYAPDFTVMNALIVVTGVLVSPRSRFSTWGYERRGEDGPFLIARLQRWLHRGTFLVAWGDVERVDEGRITFRRGYVPRDAMLPRPIRER